MCMFFMNFYDLLANFVHFLRISWRTLVEFKCVYMYIICISAPFSKCISSGCICFLGFYFLFLFLFCCFWGGILHWFHLSRGELDVGQWREGFGAGWSWFVLYFEFFYVWREYNVYIIIVIIVFVYHWLGIDSC